MIVPKGWVEKKLGDIAIRVSSGITKIRKNDGKYPLYGSTDLIGYTDTPDYSGKKILIARVGANAGIINIVDGIYGVSDNTLIVEINDNVDLIFLYSQLYNKKLNHLIFGSGQPLITGAQLKELDILLPQAKTEQCAIATTLSDTDALITAMEKLIAKKLAIKQGAMQELLTGKRRLPGFSGKWEEKPLKAICAKITTGKLDANAMINGGQYRFYTCAKDYYYIDDYAFDAEALLVSGNGENVGYVHYYKGKFNAYQRTYVLTDFSVEINWLKHFMDMFLSARIANEVNLGNTPYIRLDTLTDMIINCPELPEQTAIASIISDMDAEIDVLTTKLNKIRNIKQGMMSELLTGRIRLVGQKTVYKYPATAKGSEKLGQAAEPKIKYKSGGKEHAKN